MINGHLKKQEAEGDRNFLINAWHNFSRTGSIHARGRAGQEFVRDIDISHVLCAVVSRAKCLIGLNIAAGGSNNKHRTHHLLCIDTRLQQYYKDGRTDRQI